MKIPRNLNGKGAVRALRRAGFERLRQTDSHVIMRNQARVVVFPLLKPLKRDALKAIIEQAGLTLEDFVGFLRGRCVQNDDLDGLVGLTANEFFAMLNGGKKS